MTRVGGQNAFVIRTGQNRFVWGQKIKKIMQNPIRNRDGKDSVRSGYHLLLLSNDPVRLG
jgi:hypothetical protein